MFSLTKVHQPFKRLLATAAFAFVVAASASSVAEVRSPVLMINDDAATADVAVETLRGGVSVLTGSGGNIGVYVGQSGKFLVDAGIASSRSKIVSALDSLGRVPVKFVVDTHYHWDHTDGNGWLRQAGATIIAHDNTLKRLSTGTRVIEWGFYFPPTPPGALPNETVQRERTIAFDGETVVVTHFGAGHTDTDLAVHFRNADVLLVGDLWWNGHYPFIDNGAGGSIDGVIAWTERLIKAATPRTIVVPGHGPVGTRAELSEFRDMLVAVRGNVAKLKKQGKTLAETIAANPTAHFDKQYGDFLISPAFFVQLVYMGV